MQYVRSISGSISKNWNSLNPATLSGAIDVIVIQQEDGSLSCSPFHIRFGKFSLLRPYDKRVEFRVNGIKQNYNMKLAEGGEAFFVFETEENIPEEMQTSPLISPATSPAGLSTEQITPTAELSEPTFLDISDESRLRASPSVPGSPGKIGRPVTSFEGSSSLPRADLDSPFLNGHASEPAQASSLASSTPNNDSQILGPPLALLRSASEDLLPSVTREQLEALSFTLPRPPTISGLGDIEKPGPMSGSASPPPLQPREALNRAMTLSKKLSTANIRSHVTDTGDLMLDMTGYKSSEDDSLRAEVIARKILSEEVEGDYDIGSLIGTDENGNLWIYSSEEARDSANRRAAMQGLNIIPTITGDTSSDPGYASDEDRSSSPPIAAKMHQRAKSENDSDGRLAPPETSRKFARTLRLGSDQLKALNLKPGANPISFTVNRATCPAYMYLWTYDTPIVISDIDGTITKSDVLGHVLNTIGRDWTHPGVAKLYHDIMSNGYNIFYLTSRSVGQADSTRTYLDGIKQDGCRLPKGPVIMSPDRTIAALRREVYLRKPEVFKMACLRDIASLFPSRVTPFYAGFGNRATDALSYRTVHIPSSRIFTINSSAEVSLDLLGLNKYKSSYVTMREVVDHFFPPISQLVREGGEDFTDFNYWRDTPEGLDDFIPSDSEQGDYDDEDDEDGGEMGDSYISRDSLDPPTLRDALRESIELTTSRGSASDGRDFAEDYLGENTPEAPKMQQIMPGSN